MRIRNFEAEVVGEIEQVFNLEQIEHLMWKELHVQDEMKQNTKEQVTKRDEVTTQGRDKTDIQRGHKAETQE